MNILNPQQGTFAQEIAAAGSSDFRLPLVSVVIVNYNYGRFLNQAVDSVFGQAYPNMECVVVDNASTDESPEVLGRDCGALPADAHYPRASNDGQSAASLDGFAAASGAYVDFMDADDLLLPQAAADAYVSRIFRCACMSASRPATCCKARTIRLSSALAKNSTAIFSAEKDATKFAAQLRTRISAGMAAARY